MGRKSGRYCRVRAQLREKEKNLRTGRAVRVTARTTRRGYRYWAAAVAVVAGSLLMPTVAGAAPLGWSFDSGSNLDWYVGQDYTNPPLFANLSPTGGNPDGYVPGTDSAAETGCPGLPCNLLTFNYGNAPILTFPGGLLDKYGGDFSLDFNSSVTPVHPLGIEIVSSSGDAVVTDVSVPGTGWQHLSVPLQESSWDYCAATCAAATTVQMKCVLADTEGGALNLIADLDSPSGTGETYGIDNVLFTDGPPTTSPECGPPAAPAAPQAAGPTGQRAAALQKCNKKFPKGPKRKKCTKKAKKLPV